MTVNTGAAVRRSQRMQPIQRLAGERSQKAAKRLAERREARDQEHERLGQLQGFRREYEQRFAVTAEDGMDAYRLRDYNAFMARIDTAIRQQRDTVGKLDTEVEGLRQDWLKTWGDARALEKLVDRYRDQERRHDEAREQHESDEFAQRRTPGDGGYGETK